MSKRDEIKELFAQGKRPGDPEIEALGLKSDTIDKYYREWKELTEPEEPPKPQEPVEAGCLEPDQNFELDGEIYTVSAVYPFGVMAVPYEPAPERKLIERISPDTLVKPME